MPTHNIRASDLKGIERELKAQLRKDNKERSRRIRAAVLRAAKKTQRYVAAVTIPIAFKELIESLDVRQLSGNAARVFADAPHAAAAEVGSRPHVPPLAPLIAWVRLRGMQGLRSPRRQRGSTTASHSRSIAAMIRSHENKGAVSVDVPEQIARAIQHAIATRGTKPHRYMQKAMPFAQETLYEEVSAAVPDP